MKTDTITSMCGVCPAGCGVTVHLVDGKIERLTPLENHPLGVVCPRGLQAREVVYSPDRLLYPQQRAGKQFERVSWETAYDGMVEKLRWLAARYGPECVCVYTGRGNFEFGLNETFAPSNTADDLRRHPDGLPFTVPEMQYRKYEKGLLREDGRPGFNTPTGKFEITSEWFRQYGYEPLPVYTEPIEGPISSPDCAAQYPLVLNTGARTQSGFRSQHHNIPSLVAKHPHPLVNIHQDDADERGIAEGDEVLVISPRGRVPFHAHLTGDIVSGVVEVNMGGGGPLGPPAWQRGNVNELTDFDNRDPISGFPVYKALLCEVVKVETRPFAPER